MRPAEGAYIPPWSGRRRTEALAKVKAEGRAVDAPCVICDQPINYDLPSEHPQSCSVQHLKPRGQFPELTWEPSNWAPSHSDCNKSEGGRGQRGLGVTSIEW